jgi:hypothetical protein
LKAALKEAAFFISEKVTVYAWGLLRRPNGLLAMTILGGTKHGNLPL